MHRLLTIAIIALVAACAGSSVPPSSPPAPASATPSVTAPPAPSAAATPRPVPSAQPSPTPAAIRFEQVTAIDGVELRDVVAFDGGFVAAGCELVPQSAGSEGGCRRVVALHSADGRSWTEGEVTGGDDRQVFGLAVTPLGLLMFGSLLGSEPPLERAVWRSDDGRRWEPFEVAAPGSILYTEAVILDGRTVLIGLDSAYDFSVETEVLSTDGATWTAGVAPSMAKVAAAPGIVAAGVACVDVCPDDLPVTVSRSTDGLVWTEDPLDPALAQARADVVGTWRGRAVLGGSAAGEGAEGSGPAVWLDEPGGWRRSPLEDAASGTVEAVLDAGETLLVMTRQDADAPAEAWTTVDGRVWEAVPVDGVFHGYVVAHAGRGPIVAIVDYDTIWASLP